MAENVVAGSWPMPRTQAETLYAENCRLRAVLREIVEAFDVPILDEDSIRECEGILEIAIDKAREVLR